MQLHEGEFCLFNVTGTEHEVISVDGCDHLSLFHPSQASVVDLVLKL